jgi:hypothetical protein
MTDECITVYMNGVPHQVLNTSSYFEEVKEAIKDLDWEQVAILVDLSKCVREFIESTHGDITLEDGIVYYMGEPTNSVITDRILQMNAEGFDVTPLVNFLENLMMNPSKTAVEELYLFLASGHLPITEDGHFLAYKNVQSNYYDKHSGTVRYRIGDKPSMPRNKVDDNRNNLCSTGLHFCSIEYLNKMWGHSGRTMVVKINPADVVSIPADYNNTKGRAWTMEVIGEIDSSKGEFTKASVVEQDDYEDLFNDDEYDPYDDGKF